VGRLVPARSDPLAHHPPAALTGHRPSHIRGTPDRLPVPLSTCPARQRRVYGSHEAVSLTGQQKQVDDLSHRCPVKHTSEAMTPPAAATARENAGGDQLATITELSDADRAMLQSFLGALVNRARLKRFTAEIS
jgi:hypothetical protein